MPPTNSTWKKWCSSFPFPANLPYFHPMKICFATNNPKKLEEVKAALGKEFEIVSLAEIGCSEELPETGDTLEHNAFQKAQYVKTHYGVDCFADDTGLEVEALDGAPGVYSGRFAGEPRSDERNLSLLLERMRDKTNRKASFRTVIALLLGNDSHAFEGKVSGEILRKRSGEAGFGYDPVFRPEGYKETFAELSMQEKNAISHRGRAVRTLADFLKAGAAGKNQSS
jgi:XTP/dITP diphosphohydrolase